MNVKCPYCGCGYEINSGLLNDPIGSEKLGYGWWLRCYKCKKKWWLKNSTVEMTLNSPLIADRQDKINKISKLRVPNRSKPINNKETSHIIKYILLITLVAFIGIAIYNKDVFYEYLLNKAKHLSSVVENRLVMSDVKYSIAEDKITVLGKITNKDAVVAKLNGVKISLYNSSGTEINSWNHKLSYDYVISGDTIDFSTSEKMPLNENCARVDVSIF